MGPPPVIVATGARTPLGLSSAASAAALRAGINRLGQHAFLIDRLGKPMVAAPDARLDPGVVGNPRLLALARSALDEACQFLREHASSLGPAPLHLALPEFRPGWSESDAASLGRQLSALRAPVEIGEVKLYPRGHAAGVAALRAAVADLATGMVDVCLVGGVDSYLHPDTMEWLDNHRQLAGEDGRSAFVPGEGAAFLLLMTDYGSRRLGLRNQGTISALALTTETKRIKTPETCLGEGLTAAVQAVTATLASGDQIHNVICDINGERYRGEEWGFVCLRLAERFDDPLAYRSPADSWGDMGAASIPLFTMLACEAAARGYASGSRTLLWASSEGGQRGASLIEAEVALG
ncbi:MAG TPA: beta-ketoacyl synthase N-terminal-like domain-containing protein [Polyangiaceae bacterium]